VLAAGRKRRPQPLLLSHTAIRPLQLVPAKSSAAGIGLLKGKATDLVPALFVAANLNSAAIESRQQRSGRWSFSCGGHGDFRPLGLSRLLPRKQCDSRAIQRRAPPI